MLQFLAPTWLLALITLTIPLVIHLLNRKSGKKKPFGSVQLLQESVTSRLKSMKLNEIPLLLLRLAILIFLVMLLAKPLWMSPPALDGQNPRRWVLVEPEHYPGQHDSSVFSTIDSLFSEDYEIRAFAAGFPAIDWPADGFASQKATDTWSLIRELNTILPAESQVFLIASPLLAGFMGRRPGIQFDLRWKNSGKTGTSHWLQSLEHDDKAFRLILGISDSTGTGFREIEDKLPAQDMTITPDQGPPIALKVGGNDSLKASMPGTDDFPVESRIATSGPGDSQTILIFHDISRRDDAQYIRLALITLGEMTSYNYAIVINPDTTRLSGAEVVFWLSPLPPSPTVLRWVDQGAVLIADGVDDQYSLTDAPVRSVRQETSLETKLRRLHAPPSNAISIWTDGFDQAIMQYQPVGSGFHFQFNSRFHPDWGDLVLTAEFPIRLLRLMTQPSLTVRESLTMPSRDRRMIDVSQLLPRQVHSDPMAADFHSQDLHFILLILAVALLTIERWLSARRAV